MSMYLPFMQSSLRDGSILQAYRGLKPTAKFSQPLSRRKPFNSSRLPSYTIVVPEIHSGIRDRRRVPQGWFHQGRTCGIRAQIRRADRSVRGLVFQTRLNRSQVSQESCSKFCRAAPTIESEIGEEPSPGTDVFTGLRVGWFLGRG